MALSGGGLRPTTNFPVPKGGEFQPSPKGTLLKLFLKFNKGEISCRGGENGECICKAPTILELAVARGKASGNHTASDTIIYSQGPGSDRLYAALDNTDIYICDGGCFKITDPVKCSFN